ncbi:Sporulation-specific protein 2 [Candida viswanathii]|uniref:Sporulation-specific protein 2 n=1 Tax=Candida viswanathii TaxID=5486 RepID=A0A367XM48_9ASCO|nr:Sporulation-specific protein 2 [Candida viswanathii]
MLKSIMHSDSYLLESSPAQMASNSTTTATNNSSLRKSNTSTNHSHHHHHHNHTGGGSSVRVPSFTFSRMVSDDGQTSFATNNPKFSTIHGTSSSSRRNNFLKVCSWPFTRIESLHDQTKSDDFDFRDDQSTLGNDEKNLTITNYSAKKRNNGGPLTGINPSLENINHVANDKLYKVFNRVRKPVNEQVSKKRCVVLSNINESMGLNSIIQQVCGGPLEKLVVLPNGKIELYFIFPEHAKQFYTYGKATGLLMVNGIKLRVEWLNDENNPVNFTLSKSLMTDILQNGCRRCLIISKNIPGKRIRNGDKMFYPEPDIHYSGNLNLDEIRADFVRFGKIMDIGSVISRKLCFSIFYFDIRCAILAKQELDLVGSELSKKYKDWSVWYGKDITDRACFVL